MIPALEVLAVKNNQDEMVPACPDCGKPMKRAGDLWECQVAALGYRLGKIGEGFVHKEFRSYRAIQFTLLNGAIV